MPTTSESLSNIRNPHSCKTNTTPVQGQGGGSPQQGPEFYVSDKAERTQKEIQCSQQHYKAGEFSEVPVPFCSDRLILGQAINKMRLIQWL